MKRPVVAALLVVAVAALAAVTTRSCAQASLSVTYGNQGLEQLAYNGVVLEDLSQNPSDLFHIWHMKATDLQGNLLSQGQYGWGETNNGRSWDASTHTWTYLFIWGSISLTFAQSGNAMNMTVTTSNAANSGIIFDGATIYPFALHFPQTPLGFATPPIAQYSFNTTGPSVLLADYNQGEVASVVPDGTKPLYSGFVPASSANVYTPIVSGTTPDGLAVFLPHNDRPILPGQTDVATVSLRFAPSATPVASIAADVYQDWAQTWPPQLNWTDRRIVGTVYLASSPQGDPSQPAGYPNNPRRYFNDSNPADFDVNTAAGLAAFQARILLQAQSNVQNLQKLNAQGAITWDIEGEQYPQPTSYACSPDQIETLAPEMESVVTDPASPYNGMKLDDAYFKTMRDAGFKVGVCVRPQHFTLEPGNKAWQSTLNDAAVEGELFAKMKYAHDRWDATIFYVDSDVETDGAVLSADIFHALALKLPYTLIVPEESTPKHYAYTAPLLSFLFHSDLATPAEIYNYYPEAFSLNLVNDVNPATLAQYTPQLTEAVRRGDILMVHADYWQANNPTVVQIYQSAHASK